MNDTPYKIYKKQSEIFLAKPLEERLRINIGLTEFVRDSARLRIHRQHPEYSENEVKAELFRQCYANDFPNDELEKIAEWLRNK